MNRSSLPFFSFNFFFTHPPPPLIYLIICTLPCLILLFSFPTFLLNCFPFCFHYCIFLFFFSLNFLCFSSMRILLHLKMKRFYISFRDYFVAFICNFNKVFKLFFSQFNYRTSVSWCSFLIIPYLNK